MDAVTHGEVLHLTSPPMRSDSVRAAQELLLHNEHGTYDPGATDGVWGERSAAATRRAQYWLGFPEREVDGVFTPELADLLTGRGELTSAQKAMRARRTRRANRARLWTDAFDFAMSELGSHEEPAGSNACEFSEWYRVRGPWGLMFISWCYAMAGSRAFAPGRRYSYAPHLLADAVRSANRLSVTERPLQGDLVIYDLDGDGVADHAGMFDAWRDAEWHELRAIEGVSSCFGENAGEVMLRSRQASEVLAFVHVRG